MVDEKTTDSPLEAAAGAASPAAIEAFSLLGNETRLSILLALWEAYEPYADENAVSFSELRERCGRPDSGQFNYHLDKLDGQFLRSTEEGWELRRVGRQLVQTVIAGTGLAEESLTPTEIDDECPRCGANTVVAYEDGGIFLFCSECEGHWEEDELPGGIIAGGGFNPAGLFDRTPEEILNAFLSMLQCNLLSGAQGVCAVCSGPMRTSVSVCDDHVAEGVCTNCGERWPITVHLRCPVCKQANRDSPMNFVTNHPAVIGFFDERGVPLQYENRGLSTYETLHEAWELELASEEPRRIRVRFRYDGDRLGLLLDEEMNVLEITEPD